MPIEIAQAADVCSDTIRDGWMRIELTPNGWSSLSTSEKIERATVTIEEAAKILGIGRASAYEAARTGQIPTLRIGAKRLVVPKRALERLLEQASDGHEDRER